jgi:hypothetical protein
MRIFSNRDKQLTVEELEEQVNEFLGTVYQVERILQSGGDYFTTINVCYWDRPSTLGNERADEGLTRLEDELGEDDFLPGGSAGTGEELRHTHALAAQGARTLGFGMDEGLELPGLDATTDDLRRSNVEGYLQFGRPDEPLGAEGGDDLGDSIAQSLAEELSDDFEGSTGVAPPLENPAEIAWEHAAELHRLEDGMLTWLEKLTAFRAGHPLSGPDLMDFLLSEETLVQMVEQVRAASEELAWSLREYALRHGYSPWPWSEAERGSAGAVRGAPKADGAWRIESRTWALPDIGDAEVRRLRRELDALRRKIDEASEKKDLLVTRLRNAVRSDDAERQKGVSHALEGVQKVLADLRKDLRRVREKLGEISGPERGETPNAS